MFKKYFSIFAVLFLVAACETTPETQPGDDQGMGAGSDGISSEELGAPIPGTQAHLVKTVGDRVFFDYDSSSIKGDAQDTMKSQAEWLKTYSDVSVTIEGHCDERGTREYNLALGERRANAAKNYLVSLGIPAGRISTISYGKEYPEDPASSEVSWSKNRRAVTVVTSK